MTPVNLNVLCVQFFAFLIASLCVHGGIHDKCVSYCSSNTSDCFASVGNTISYSMQLFTHNGTDESSLTIKLTFYPFIPGVNLNAHSLTDVLVNNNVMITQDFYFDFPNLGYKWAKGHRNQTHFVFTIERVTPKHSGEYNFTITTNSSIKTITLDHYHVLCVMHSSPECKAKLLQTSHYAPYGLFLICTVRKGFVPVKPTILSNSGCSLLTSSSSNHSVAVVTAFTPLCQESHFICFAEEQNISYYVSAENCTFNVTSLLNDFERGLKSTLFTALGHPIVDLIVLCFIITWFFTCVSYVVSKRCKQVKACKTDTTKPTKKDTGQADECDLQIYENSAHTHSKIFQSEQLYDDLS